MVEVPCSNPVSQLPCLGFLSAMRRSPCPRRRRSRQRRAISQATLLKIQRLRNADVKKTRIRISHKNLPRKRATFAHRSCRSRLGHSHRCISIRDACPVTVQRQSIRFSDPMVCNAPCTTGLPVNGRVESGWTYSNLGVRLTPFTSTGCTNFPSSPDFGTSR